MKLTNVIRPNDFAGIGLNPDKGCAALFPVSDHIPVAVRPTAQVGAEIGQKFHSTILSRRFIEKQTPLFVSHQFRVITSEKIRRISNGIARSAAAILRVLVDFNGQPFRRVNQPLYVRFVHATSILLFLASFVNAADLASPETFVDTPGDPNAVVNAARLNNLVGGATILPTFYSGKPSTSPIGADLVMVYEPGTLQLKTCTATSLVALSPGLTSVALSMPAVFSVSNSPLTTNGTIAVTLATETANLFWAGPASGSAATPTFRALVPLDTSVATNGTVSTTIDWSSAFQFDRTLTTNTTFTFTNPQPYPIVVFVHQASSGGPYTATFTSAVWPGGSAPVMTTTASKCDVFTFTYNGSTIYAAVSQNY